MINSTSSQQTMFLFQESGNEYAIVSSKIFEVIQRPQMFIPSPLPNCIGCVYIEGKLIKVFSSITGDGEYIDNDLIRNVVVFRVFHEKHDYWLGFKADDIKGIINIEVEKVFLREEWPTINIPSFAKGIFFNRNKPVFVIDPLSLLISSYSEYFTENQILDCTVSI